MDGESCLRSAAPPLRHVGALGITCDDDSVRDDDSDESSVDGGGSATGDGTRAVAPSGATGTAYTSELRLRLKLQNGTTHKAARGRANPAVPAHSASMDDSVPDVRLRAPRMVTLLTRTVALTVTLTRALTASAADGDLRSYSYASCPWRGLTHTPTPWPDYTPTLADSYPHPPT